MTHALQDRSVIITGAGKGLGKAYALYLAKLGANVVVNNRSHAGEDAASADLVVEEIRQHGGTAVADYSSVEDPQAGDRLLATALEQFGRLDALVANAGVSEAKTFHNQSLAEFQKVIDINLTGTVNVVHPVFRHLYQQSAGCVLVSTSVAGLYGEHGLPAYSTSKAALLGLMYALSLEGARHGVRVNALAPFAATAMTEEKLTPELSALMQAGYVAPVVAWLISENCAVNGEIIISGAGRMSRGRVLETRSLPLPAAEPFAADQIEAVWNKLLAGPPGQPHQSALKQFKTFLVD